MRGFRRILVVCAVGAVLVGAPLSATAVPDGTIGSFPSYTLTSPAGGTVSFSSPDLPSGTFVTDGGGLAAASGAAAFLGTSTGFGQYFGATRLQPYLSLGTAGGSGPTAQPSTTTFAFDAPLPLGSGFAVGDIDADLVEVIALGGDGAVLSGAQLGAQDTGGTPPLNYCTNTPRPSTCGGGPFTDAPRWYPDGTTVGSTVYDTPAVVGNGTDTRGAYDWFVPTVPVQTLTLRFSAQIGAPSYQIWLAAPAPASVIRGEVVRPDGAPAPSGTVVGLESAAGVPVPGLVGDPVTVEVSPDGVFEIPVEQGDYRLTFAVPEGYDPIAPLAVEATSPSVDLGVVRLAPVVVAPPAPPPAGPPPSVPAPPGAELAATGAADPALTLGGGLLVVLGTVLLVGARVRTPGRRRE